VGALNAIEFYSDHLDCACSEATAALR
jgi:hypothetical protein